MLHRPPRELTAACPPLSTWAGTWQHEVEAVDGKIVITRKDGSKAVLTYSEATSPADVRGCACCSGALWACKEQGPACAAHRSASIGSWRCTAAHGVA